MTATSGASGPTARRVTVHGRVQGVFFRDTCRQEAERLGVSGWVSNEPDGTVAGFFEGSREAVEALVGWCRVGPPYARVQRVVQAEATPTGARGFSIR